MDFSNVVAAELRFDPRDPRQSGGQGQSRRQGGRSAAPSAPARKRAVEGGFNALANQLGDLLGAAGAPRTYDYQR